MVRVREKEKKRRRFATFKCWDHIETDTFFWDFEKVAEDIMRFCEMYDLQIIAIIKDFW